MLEQDLVPLKVALFVDGLDEFEGSQEILVDLLKSLPTSDNFKICISSRPLPFLEEVFQHHPKLKLQDFTKAGLQTFVTEQLLEQQRLHQMEAVRLHDIERLAERVVSKAEGVFLWAIIVVRDIRQGLYNMDTEKEFEERILAMPSEIEDLYSTILFHRIPSIYHRDAAKYFQIDIYSEAELGLLAIHLVNENCVVNDSPWNYDPEPLNGLQARCEMLKTRILARTAGLLEITEYRLRGKNLISEDIESDQYTLFFETRIKLIHKTALEFLLLSDRGGKFLEINGSPDVDIDLSLTRGLLAHTYYYVSYFSDVRPVNMTAMAITEVFEHLSQVERLTGTAQSSFTESIDYTSISSKWHEDSKQQTELLPRTTEPWWYDHFGNRIDLVGLAAFVGMSIYVMQKLKTGEVNDGFQLIPNEQAPYSFGSTHPVPVANNSFEKYDPRFGRQDEDLAASCTHSLRGLDYRTVVQSWLGQPQNQIDPSSNLVESYLLLCTLRADIPSLGLIRDLLAAGANPNCEFQIKDYEPTNPFKMWLPKAQLWWLHSDLFIIIVADKELSRNIISTLLQFGAKTPKQYVSFVQEITGQSIDNSSRD